MQVEDRLLLQSQRQQHSGLWALGNKVSVSRVGCSKSSDLLFGLLLTSTEKLSGLYGCSPLVSKALQLSGEKAVQKLAWLHFDLHTNYWTVFWLSYVGLKMSQWHKNRSESYSQPIWNKS